MLQLKTEKGEVLAELDRERTAIGRDPANEVVLEDTSVSGFHAVILNDRGAVSVVDLGSTNGTAIDGRRLHERTPLKAWCTLQVGALKLQVADTETREPTRVQPVVSVAGPERQRTVPVQRTQLTPAAESDTRVVRPAAESDTRAASPAVRAPADRFDPPPRTPAAPPAAMPPPPLPNPAVVPDPSPRTATHAYSLFGGYPRGFAWLLFSFKGRVGRLLFWKTFGVAVLLFLIPLLITVLFLQAVGFGRDSAVGISSGLYSLLTMWPWLAILAKRIHDSGGKAVPWCMAALGMGLLQIVANLSGTTAFSRGELTVYGLLVVLLFFPSAYILYLAGIKRGDDGDNDYGDQNPRTGIVFG